MANKNKQTKPKKVKINQFWIIGAILVFFLGLQVFSDANSGATTVTWNKIETFLKAGEIERFEVVNKEEARVYIKEAALSKEQHKSVSTTALGKRVNRGPHYVFNIGTPEIFEQKIERAAQDFPQARDVDVQYTTVHNFWGDILSWMFPIFLILIFSMFMMRRVSNSMGGGGAGGQIFNVGRSKAKIYDEKDQTKVTFADVAGLHEAKEEVEEIVNFLKEPKKYTDLGGNIPKGALLVGPPGTGKTLLAKAVAGEAGVPFFSLSGSDFVEMFVGVGASRVRDLFKQAKDKSPCIIFIDEIDAIGRARGKNQMTGANDERENTLNQLLTEMDGFGSKTNVIVLAATNRADILDKALTRPGRFDRQIHIDLPELKDRKDIFKVYLDRLKKKSDDIDVDFLAKQTPGFSGADVANICNEAALIAARKNKKQIEKQDFLDAIDRVIAGLEKKSKIISKDEKEVIAYHEAGHATVSWLLRYASPLVKVTIVPRGRSLGAAWYLPEERQLSSAEQIEDEMCAALGGRAAEDIIFNRITTGALSDLEKVTKQAQAMVTVYGLNEKLGNITYYDSSGNDSMFNKPYSEKTAELIDQEIKKIIDAQYDRAKQILTDNKDKLEVLAKALIEKEVIFKDDLVEIFGKRPFEQKEETEHQTMTSEASSEEQLS